MVVLACRICGSYDTVNPVRTNMRSELTSVNSRAADSSLAERLSDRDVVRKNSKKRD